LRGYVASDPYAHRLIPIRTEVAALLRAGRLREAVSQFEGLASARVGLATIFDRGSPDVGNRAVRISAE
jgi:hypothetical protein